MLRRGTQVGDRRSCTCTKPSYHPEAKILSDAPQGNPGGVLEMPYTADDLSDSKSLTEDQRTEEGVAEISEFVMVCTARGLSDDVPNAA